MLETTQSQSQSANQNVLSAWREKCLSAIIQKNSATLHSTNDSNKLRKCEELCSAREREAELKVTCAEASMLEAEVMRKR